MQIVKYFIFMILCEMKEYNMIVFPIFFVSIIHVFLHFLILRCIKIKNLFLSNNFTYILLFI